MAFTEKKLPVAREKYFQFFVTGSETNAEMVESLAPSFAFELERIRLRLSAVHVSAEDFTATISHHIDSVYNEPLISYAILGSQDILSAFTPTKKYHLGDTINFSLIISSPNTYAIEVSGWYITNA